MFPPETLSRRRAANRVLGEPVTGLFAVWRQRGTLPQGRFTRSAKRIVNICCSGLRGLVAYSALKRGPYPLECYQLGERNVTDVGDEDYEGWQQGQSPILAVALTIVAVSCGRGSEDISNPDLSPSPAHLRRPGLVPATV